MNLLVTYCSRDKDPAPGEIPAIVRYRSPRIRAAARAAGNLGVGLHILSGKFGLIPADRPIPDYDHLLTADGIAEQARDVADSLRASGAERVVFVTRTLAADPATEPYRETMTRACSQIGVPMEILEIISPEKTFADLTGRIRTMLA